MARFKLDETDHQILDMLIENARTPFTDIAKALDISAGTVHLRVRKMEEAGIIQGSTLTIDYQKLEYTFVMYVGIYIEKNHQTQFVMERLYNIPYITEASVISGVYNIFCKVRARDTKHAKEILFQVDDIQGVTRTESMISLEEIINDTKRLMHTVFKEMKD
ncbi:Lrp/AsnC family transcriptional regulator [Capnocytophaga catalasegens]|uniref:Transcriptional regulator n=1 Tax=Capnocytophaga catalasegens TaxID=1004260 RepID=A0AAV5ATD8_9FLAO|nr:Lrp/AsnC family transcriptional regulator [Capnocytophaga catalasegens]GIZ14761.1 transcriptional regulator [Capnocytophaga catalasegens]GJM50609.1 transcriptional regulator [Capnocytophaga catalasegens]GJM53560.1 transcriptional regulator [Capnocytophaga catalasegens]